MKPLRYLTLEGREQSLTEWAQELGVTPATIWWRLRQGLPIKEVLRPHRWYARNGRPATKLTLNGRTLSLKEWAAELDMSYQAIYDRLRKGQPVEDVLAPRKWHYSGRKKA